MSKLGKAADTKRVLLRLALEKIGEELNEKEKLPEFEEKWQTVLDGVVKLSPQELASLQSGQEFVDHCTQGHGPFAEGDFCQDVREALRALPSTKRRAAKRAIVAALAVVGALGVGMLLKWMSRNGSLQGLYDTYMKPRVEAALEQARATRDRIRGRAATHNASHAHSASLAHHEERAAHHEERAEHHEGRAAHHGGRAAHHGGRAAHHEGRAAHHEERAVLHEEPDRPLAPIPSNGGAPWWNVFARKSGA